MHEVGLVEEAVQKAVSVMRAAGAASIERLTFAIAPGGHVTPEAVETLFSALSSGTPAEGAQVGFETADCECGCWSCGGTFSASDVPSTCPVCGSDSVSRFPTADLVLRYVDVADAPHNLTRGP